MKLDQKKILKTLDPGRIWIPILIGVLVVGFMLYRDPDVNSETLLQVFQVNTGIFLFALFILIVKETALILRISTISEQKISLTRCIYVILLWEFASAVTPSVVGGTAVAIFILMVERLSFGRSLAYVVVTAIMDNLFFIVSAPLMLLITGDLLFPESQNMENLMGRSLQAVFYLSYILIAVYTFIMAYAILFNPRGFKWIILKITAWNVFRRWRQSAYRQANEIVMAGSNIRNKSFRYWSLISLFTLVAWVARYSMVNILISGYSNLAFFDHLLIFGRHVVLWITMLVSPTPGSTGTAEYFFKVFYEGYLEQSTVVVAMLWRTLSYYPYLLVGAIILPRWLRVGFKRLNKKNLKDKIKLRKD